jgi:hypothetical protein
MYDMINRAVLDDTAGKVVPRWAADALSDVTSGRSHLLAIRHPLGFLCLPLERTGTRGVCVHLWTDRLPQATSTTSTTHSHSWDLVSFVLYGALYNELARVTDTRERPTHRVFAVDSGPDGDVIRWTDRLVHREHGSQELYHGGEVYSLPAGVFHCTNAMGEVATVALGSGHPGAVDLVLGAFDTPTHGVRRQLCSRDETVLAATMVAGRLTKVPR